MSSSTHIKSSTQNSAQELLKHPNLWRAGQLNSLSRQHSTGIATGYTVLDEHLPGQGWPSAGLMELMLNCAGIGELRTLAPALKTLSQTENRWIAWVNPPFIPYAPALESVGIDTRKILLIHPRHHQDALWSLERACKSGSCSAVLAWLDDKQFKLKDSQRLQVAAKQGKTLTCLFRPQHAQSNASMAELRLALHSPQVNEVRVDILKRRGGWPVQDLRLDIAQATTTQQASMTDVQQQLTLWRTGEEAKPIQHNTTPADEAMSSLSEGMAANSKSAIATHAPAHAMSVH